MNYDNAIDRSSPIWENPDFPHFYSNAQALEALEGMAFESAGGLGSSKDQDDALLKVEEVYYNSVIEGEELNRDSIRSSLNKNLTNQAPNDKEEGAVKLLEMAIDHKEEVLTHELVQGMNEVVLMNHSEERMRRQAGEYVGDMLIIKGGRLGQAVIEDKGVPKERVAEEMGKFISWFNNRNRTTPLSNAIQGHLHFEKIHPFADGNGRVGRALMNMGLMVDLGIETPLALSKAIQFNRKSYYRSFAHSRLDLTELIKEFAPIVLQAIEETKKIIELTNLRKIAYKTDLNERQLKALEKVISREVSDRFDGQMTNGKYRKLVGNVEHKTAQRDLLDMVEKGILLKKGKLKGTHYPLNISTNTSKNCSISP